ncbi:hypothetical protein [Oceanospirillum sediminis]|uniref:Uncharacterized protein n=1 Tax=Oceanospirillum sediminis TaxID=2760088 RepID=A0A839IMM3_9GAMM|nr:hypothetical protein [Oceanospirillum sediminis]MBB1486673.1 hypothetical protein [Oceanospirillum sediminis]
MSAIFFRDNSFNRDIVIPMARSAFLLVFMALIALPVQASWQQLGRQAVSGEADMNWIQVRNPDGFRQLRLMVKGAGVRIHRMTLVFQNGERYIARIDRFIPANSESHLINLPGGSRVIRQISFFYDARGLGQKRSVLSVWGRP